MTLESSLQIGLHRQAGRVGEVTICSSRPLQAVRIFHGRTVDEMLKTLPLLYHVCGVAQSAAAVAASEQALGIDPGPASRRGREMLVLMETAREHLWHITTAWAEPAARQALAPAMARLPQWLGELQQALFAEAGAFSPGARPKVRAEAVQDVIRRLEQLLTEAVFAGPPEQWSGITSLAAFEAWLQDTQTVAARRLAQVAAQPLHERSAERVEVAFLPALAEAELHRRFIAADADEFSARPLWDGRPCETTALARQRRHALVSDMLTANGNGELTRMVARLVELAAIPQRLRLLVGELLNEMLDALPETTPAADAVRSQGIGQVEAARGRLIHRLELEAGRVGRYQILAPTEWNFHPQGVAAQLLKTLPAMDEQGLRTQAERLIAAVDPCVRYEITVH